MCAALATISSNPPSLRIFHTGVQYTPVASIATCVHRHSVNHASRANKPSVVVAKVRQSRLTLRLLISRTQATTVALCTSRPATRLWITSIFTPPHLCRRRGGLCQSEI